MVVRPEVDGPLLRTATRLWPLQGKTNEARDLFAPAYNWFTEGFDTAVLKDAKTFVDALSEGEGK